MREKSKRKKEVKIHNKVRTKVGESKRGNIKIKQVKCKENKLREG